MLLIDYVKDIKHSLDIVRVLKIDIRKYKKFFASSGYSNKSGTRYARNILVYCHVVEKGLSHKRIKPLFGYDRVLMIADSLKEYISRGGKDSFVIGLAFSTLERYNSENQKLGVSDDKLIKIPSIAEKAENVPVGIESISSSDYFAYSNIGFAELAKKRRSIRLYDCKSESISLDEIMQCIEIAQHCPSACNRQAVRVKVVLDRELIDKVCKVQGGANGFGENSGALLIVTADMSLYEAFERRLPMLDCGLFIMNLCYALYEKQLGTCILNGSFTLEREKEMSRLVPINDREMYAAVIAVSKIPQDEMIKVAHSCKYRVEEIVTLIDAEK